MVYQKIHESGEDGSYTRKEREMQTILHYELQCCVGCRDEANGELAKYEVIRDERMHTNIQSCNGYMHPGKHRYFQIKKLIHCFVSGALKSPDS